MGKLRIVWIAVLFVLGCSGQWDPPDTGSAQQEARKATVSTTYDGDPAAFPTSITIPSDLDPKPAASVNVALEALADRTAFLHRSLSAPGDTLQLTLAQGQPSAEFQYVFSPTVAAGWLQNNVASAGSLVIEIPNEIRYFEFTAIDVFVNGSISGGGHGALPATMPRVKLYRELDPDTAPGPTLLATQIDSSANPAAYDTDHRITLVLGGTQVIDHSAGAISGFPYARWVVEIQGEAGANSIANEFFVKAIILS